MNYLALRGYVKSFVPCEATARMPPRRILSGFLLRLSWYYLYRPKGRGMDPAFQSTYQALSVQAPIME
jgi:hypothetical protein